MPVSAGTAYLDVVPRISRDFSRQLQQQMLKPMAASAEAGGKQVGAKFAGRFGGEVSDRISRTLGRALAGAAVLQGLKSVTEAASDMNETLSKSRVVFGPAAKSVEAFARTAATSLGQSRQQAMEAAATFGNLFVSMKIGQPQAAKMSTSMVKLAADLASFNNASPDEALEALRAGLVGETEPLRRFGINLNEAALKAEATRLGLGKIGPTLTASQRAQAAYSLILQQSTTAQGDFARTSGGLANRQRILAAQFKDLQVTAGTVLLPIMVKLAGIFVRVADFIDRNRRVMVPLLGMLGGLGAVVFTVVKALNAWAAIQKILDAELFANPIGIVIVAIAALAAGIIYAYKHSETFRKIVDGAFRAIKSIIGTVVTFILAEFRLWFNIATTVVDGILHMFGKLPGPLGAPFRKAEEAVTKAKKTVNEQLDKIQARVNKLTGKDIPITASLKLNFSPSFTQKDWLAVRVAAGRAAKGMLITQGTTPTADDVLVRVSKGETVVSAAHSRLLAPMFMRLGVPGYQRGGAIGQIDQETGFINRVQARGTSIIMDRGVTRTLGAFGGPMPASRNEAIVRSVAATFGWVGAMWAALRNLLMGESGFRNTAQNPTSTAYGIYQFLNSTWGLVGGHKTSDPRLQSIYGDRYIRRVYGNPINAYSAWLSRSPHWYDQGGFLPPGLSLAYNGTGRPERVGGGDTFYFDFRGAILPDQEALARKIRDKIRSQQARELIPTSQRLR